MSFIRNERRFWSRLLILGLLASLLTACPDDDDEPGRTDTGTDTGGDVAADMTNDMTTDMTNDMVGDMGGDMVADTSEDVATDTTDEADADAGGPGTIVEVAVAAGNFTTLAAALAAADLVGTLEGEGPFTVFAPTDDAFEAAGLNADNIGDVPGLADILTYHVLAQSAPASVVATLDGQGVATVNGVKVYVSAGEDGVFLNDLGEGGIEVVTTDIPASNGIIHVIDGVLLPPTIPEVAILEGGFETLVAALVDADLVGTLDGDNEGQGWTVFAPVEAAFTAASLNPENVGEVEGLADILLYHVVPGTQNAAAVTATDLLLSALSLDPDDGTEGDEFAAPLIVDTDGGVFVNGAEVIVTDVLAANGVIHAIDAIILPDDAVGVATDAGLTTVVAAAVEAGLDGALSAPNGPYTLLVPTEDAFAAALTALTATCPGTYDSLDDIDTNLGAGTLEAVLSLHVIPGDGTSPYLPASVVVTAAGDDATIGSLGGEDTLTLGLDGASVTVASAGSTATVVDTNIPSTNAVIHTIDAVLLPDVSSVCTE